MVSAHAWPPLAAARSCRTAAQRGGIASPSLCTRSDTSSDAAPGPILKSGPIRGLKGGRFGFSKARRVRLRREYQRAQKTGLRVHAPHFVFVLMGNETGVFRLGLVVSRKVGCAVERNRAKRVLRQCFRTWERPLEGGVDLVIIAKPGAADLDLTATQEQWLHVWKLVERKAATLVASAVTPGDLGVDPR